MWRLLDLTSFEDGFMKIRGGCAVFLSISLLVSAGVLRAQDAAQSGGRPYTRSEAMIPVRDGAKLHVVILRPEGSEKSGEALPILMQRTPYGTAGSSSQGIN